MFAGLKKKIDEERTRYSVEKGSSSATSDQELEGESQASESESTEDDSIRNYEIPIGNRLSLPTVHHIAPLTSPVTKDVKNEKPENILEASDDTPRERETNETFNYPEVEILKRTNEKLTVEVLEKNEYIVSLEDKLKLLEDKIKDQDLVGGETMIALRRQRDSLSHQFDECKRELVEVKSTEVEKSDVLQRQLNKMATNKAECEDSLVKALKHLEVKEEEMRIMKAENERSNAGLQSVISDLEEQLTSGKNVAEGEIMKLRCDNAEQLEKMIEMEGSMSRVEEERSSLKNEMSVKDKEVKSLNRDILQKDKEITRVQKECIQLSCQIEDYKGKLKHSENKFESVEIEVSRVVSLKEKEWSDKLMQEIGRGKEVEMEWREKLDEINQQRDHLDSEVRKISETLVETEEEKDDLLLRNAELSQQLESHKKRSEEDADDYKKHVRQLMDEVDLVRTTIREKDEKIVDLEEQVVNMSGMCQRVDTLKAELDGLEQQISEKNRTIKVQQQRMQELKRTIQKELKLDGYMENNLPGHAVRSTSPMVPPKVNRTDTANQTTTPPFISDHPSPLSVTIPSPPLPNSGGRKESKPTLELSPGSHSEHRICVDKRNDINCDRGNGGRMGGCVRDGGDGYVVKVEDINFKYLKHVILKFMSSTEKEAHQLIRAVSTLLHLTHEEERLLGETLTWKTSWWGGAKPEIPLIEKSIISPKGSNIPSPPNITTHHHNNHRQVYK